MDRTICIEFQSSPAPKSRCNHAGTRHARRHCRVSILTGSEEPVQPAETVAALAAKMFQSSPAPKSRCNLGVRGIAEIELVSILTGSEEPVQQAEDASLAAALVVSILTGSEEPVQRHGVTG